MEKTPKELEVLERKNQHIATTITEDDAYGPLTQYEAKRILKKINSKSCEKTILRAYNLMAERNKTDISIDSIPDGFTIFPDKMPHCLGKLILEKDKGLATRMYDADFGTPFTTELTATHLKIFGLDYYEIIFRIKKWNNFGT